MVMLTLILGSGVDGLLKPVSDLGTVAVLYVGPDQLLPLTSALGALIGLLLMFWQRVIAWARRLWQSLLAHRVSKP